VMYAIIPLVFTRVSDLRMGAFIDHQRNFDEADCNRWLRGSSHIILEISLLPSLLDKRPFCFHDTRSKRDAQWKRAFAALGRSCREYVDLNKSISARSRKWRWNCRCTLSANIFMITPSHADNTSRWYQSYASRGGLSRSSSSSHVEKE